MRDAKACENHISAVLGQMVKKWENVLPEGVRALEKFNRENKNVLVKDGVEKLKILEEFAQVARLKHFTGKLSGQSIDLTAYSKVFGPIIYAASGHKSPLPGQEAS